MIVYKQIREKLRSQIYISLNGQKQQFLGSIQYGGLTA